MAIECTRAWPQGSGGGSQRRDDTTTRDSRGAQRRQAGVPLMGGRTALSVSQLTCRVAGGVRSQRACAGVGHARAARGPARAERGGGWRGAGSARGGLTVRRAAEFAGQRVRWGVVIRTGFPVSVGISTVYVYWVSSTTLGGVRSNSEGTPRGQRSNTHTPCQRGGNKQGGPSPCVCLGTAEYRHAPTRVRVNIAAC